MATITTLNNEYFRLSQVLPTDHPVLLRIVSEIEARTAREYMGEAEWKLFQETAIEESNLYSPYSSTFSYR